MHLKGELKELLQQFFSLFDFKTTLKACFLWKTIKVFLCEKAAVLVLNSYQSIIF